MMQWSPTNLHNNITKGGELDVWHVYRGLSSDNFREFFQRLICHVLVDRVPKEGIPELYEALNEIISFHISQIDQVARTLPQPIRIQGQLGQSTVRPGFSIVYDEE